MKLESKDNRVISFNQVILTGKVATPLRLYYRPDGSQVVQFSLELDKVNPDQAPEFMLVARRDDGFKIREEKLKTDERIASNNTQLRSLINVVVFGEHPEFKFESLQSGQHILIVGQLNQRSWETLEGRKKSLVEIIATNLLRVEDLDQMTLCPTCRREF